jgi:F-type H+-transporting ATPase subunit delta
MAGGSNLIARRYAKALFETTHGDAATIKNTISKLEILSKLLFGSKDLQTLFKSPAFSLEDRTSVLKDLCGIIGAEEQLRKFLYYFLESGRLLLLRELTSEVKAIAARATKEDEGVIEAAFKMSADQVQKIEKTLEAILGRKLRMEMKILPELLAGIRVKVGGKYFDLSLTNSLETMKKQLSEMVIPSKAMPEA